MTMVTCSSRMVDFQEPLPMPGNRTMVIAAIIDCGTRTAAETKGCHFVGIRGLNLILGILGTKAYGLRMTLTGQDHRHVAIEQTCQVIRTVLTRVDPTFRTIAMAPHPHGLIREQDSTRMMCLAGHHHPRSRGLSFSTPWEDSRVSRDPLSKLTLTKCPVRHVE